MANGLLIPQLIFQAFSPNGGFLSGGLLYTYQAGTSIPATVYGDPGLGGPLTNPVVLNSLGQANIWLTPGQAYKFNLTDSQGNQIPDYPVDQVNSNLSFPAVVSNIIPATNNFYTIGSSTFQWSAVYATTLYQNNIPVVSYPQTPAELSLTITPSNYLFPEGNVHRYGLPGAVGTGNATADQLAWQTAINVIGTGLSESPSVTCQQLSYLVTGLTVNGPVTIDGGNTALNYTLGTTTAGSNAQLRSTVAAVANNVPIINLPSAAVGNGVCIKNINLVGAGEGVNNVQDGLAMTATYPAYTRVFVQNVGIFNCGRYGINAASMYTSDFRDVYVQACLTGWALGPNAGANRYWNCSAVANTSTGFDLGSTNGSDVFVGCISEQNQYGIAIESGSVGHSLQGLHTERNTILSVWFKSGSDKTEIIFENNGSNESIPYNGGGSQNRWEGNFSTGNNIYPICMQRVSTSYTTNVHGSTLTAMAYAATLPTIGQGLVAMSQNITPVVQVGSNRLNVRANGFAEIAGGGTMTVALFINGGCVKAWPSTIGAAVPAGFDVSYDYFPTAAALTLASAPAVGATTATLASSFTGVTGQYNLVFSDWEIRNVTLTNGNTTMSSWAVGLLNAVTTAVTSYQASYTAQVNIGSTTASDTITMGGHSGTTYYGGAEIANITIEEFRLSSG